MNPNTTINRLYVKYGTGAGKTVMAISIALSFIKVFKYERDYANINKRKIVIIGFTKGIFRRELLRFPEFGYVNREELAKLETLKLNAKETKEGETAYGEFLSMLRKRITNRKKSGFFQFYGYREFVNRMFITPVDINSLSESDIHNRIKSGDIQVNKQLLDELKGSVIICDEIHNVYNSCDKNNWGIALQTLFNYHKDQIRVLFLSATPINHSPSEVIDLLNMLHTDRSFKKSDYFKTNTKGECILGKETLIEEIGKQFAGRMLFLEDENPKYFPTSVLVGEKIKTIPILRFIRCEMSELHNRTYLKDYQGTLSQDAQYIMDFILPNPEFKSMDDPDAVGLYKTQSVKSALRDAPTEWMTKHGIQIIQGSNMIISGDFLT